MGKGAKNRATAPGEQRAKRVGKSDGQQDPSSQRSNAKIYVTSGNQCLENLYQFKAFTERSS